MDLSIVLLQLLLLVLASAGACVGIAGAYVQLHEIDELSTANTSFVDNLPLYPDSLHLASSS